LLFVRKILLARKWLHGQISVPALLADLPDIPGLGDSDLEDKQTSHPLMASDFQKQRPTFIK